jgi:hypothetical protein
MNQLVRLDRLVGRTIHTVDGQRVGRLEEIRAVPADEEWTITEYVIGAAGLVDRLGLGLRLLVGRAARHGYIARWDQLDISHPERPTLRCAVERLERMV